jgi:hypothetical protein
MKHLKTYEFFDFFKKKKKINNNQFDIEIIKDLLESDLDGVNFRGVEVTTVLKFESCRFKSSGDKPKLTHDKNWFKEDVSYSSTGHYNGTSGFLMNYDINLINTIRKQRISNVDTNELDMRDIFFLTKKIIDSINKDRMQEFGIGYCINKHHYIGDGIVFYKL